MFLAPPLESMGTTGGKPGRGVGLVALGYLVFLIVLTSTTNHRLRR